MEQSRRVLLQKVKEVNALVSALREKQRYLTKEEVDEILKKIESEFQTISEEAEEIERASAVALARRRAPVLLVTMLIELLVAFIIVPFEKTIAKYATIYAFAPLVSAICGNYGLQTAAIVIRALSVGTLTDKVKTILRELVTGIICGLIVGITAGTIAFFTTGYWEAIVVLTSALVSGMITSGCMGALIPVIAKRLGFDPAIIAGPGETALQDTVSYFTFLAILTLLMKVTS